MTKSFSCPEWTYRNAQMIRTFPRFGRHLGCNIRTDLPANNRMPIWKSYNGFLVVRGGGVYTDWNGREWPLRPGSFGQHLPGKYHEIVRHAPEEHCEISISLSRNYYDAFVTLGAINPDQAVAQPGLSLTLLNRFYDCHKSIAAANLAELERELAKLLDLMIRIKELIRAQAEPDRFTEMIDEVKFELNRNLGEPVDIEALTKDYPISYYHFRKLFRERVGVPPGRFRLQIKMEYAEVLLAHGDMTIEAVARELGYSDRFAFSKQFRKVTGRSPGMVARDGR